MNRTPRQWLIAWSVDELKRSIRKGTAHKDRLQAARLAIEAVVDGNHKPGTLGKAIHDYYVNASETARERLDATIARLAK